MMMKETRWMNKLDLRSLCIEHNWFTHGNNNQYNKFLNMVGDHTKHLTTNTLLKMALTIQQYSDPETYEILELGGIMFCLNEICHTSFTDVTGGKERK